MIRAYVVDDERLAVQRPMSNAMARKGAVEPLTVRDLLGS